MGDIPSPQRKTIWQHQRCKFDVPADAVRIGWGYKERDTIIVEWRDGCMYLCDSRDGRLPKRHISADVPFEIFAEHWPQVVEFFQAKAAEAAGKEDG